MKAGAKTEVSPVSVLSGTKNGVSDEDVIARVADVKKRQFIKLVKAMADLRALQYGKDDNENIVREAEDVVALNIPSNLLRAAAIFVDYFYGFPPDWGSFFPPAWVLVKSVLPENERGSLVCTGLHYTSALNEKDLVVLTHDVPSFGLHAGMSGIVRETPSQHGEVNYLIEFGEPEESLTQQIEVPAALLRRPRPGDLLENYRS